MTLTFDLLTLKDRMVYQVSSDQSLYEIWAKSNNPRLSYWPFSTFTPCNFGGGAFLPNGSQLHQSWRGHEAIIPTQVVFLEFGYIAAFSNAGGSKSSDVENNAKFRTFWPLWKLGEGWARSLYQYSWSFTYDWTSGIHFLDIHSAAAERAVDW